jgi:IS66 Orf2 like protein
MIEAVKIRRVCLIRHKVDFRKGHTGMLSEAYQMGLNPYEGDLIVYVGRNKNKIRILFADTTGIWLGQKIFHRGCVPRAFEFLEQREVTVISVKVVAKLLEGTKFLLA